MRKINRILILFIILFLPICVKAENPSWTFDYTGDIQTFNVPYSGVYKLEVWGAQGGISYANGSQQDIGGYGGYATGNITIKSKESLYIVVGGKGGIGSFSACSTGGYNGGGTGSNDGGGCGGSNDDEAAGGGGGATHIATTNRGLLSSYSSYQNEVLIVAGGGGGASWTFPGGTGGGTNGGINSYTTSSYSTQTTGYAFGVGQNGSGAANGDGVAGGGGGWYGGYTANVSYQSAGTGGSGYIGGVTDGSMTNGSRAGNGYAKLTLVSYSDTDARINAVDFSTGTFSQQFDKDIYEYTVNVDSEIASLTINATPYLSTSTISGIGNYTIKVGTNDIYLNATAESGDIKTYVFHVIRNASSYKYLNDIKINGTSISNFSPETLNYSINATYDEEIADITVTNGRPSQVVTLPDSNLDSGTSIKTITVVSEDGLSTVIYTLTFSRPHSTKLKSINIDDYALDEKFDSNVTTYNVYVMLSTMSLDITAIPYDNNATVSITGNKYIKVGVNTTVTISVTESNYDTTTYTLSIVRGGVSKDTEYVFDYTGSSQTFTADHTGYYKFESWGARGGGTGGGLGGYTSGKIRLIKGQNIYIYVGQYPSYYTGLCYTTNANSSFNGALEGSCAGGGGATDFRLIDGSWNDTSSLASRIMVAAGGGGSIYNDSGYGGYGGGLTGGVAKGIATYTTDPNFKVGNPGTQMPTTTFGVTTALSTTGGGGYYTGNGGYGGNAGGGSSFISGYTGAVAVTSSTDTTPKSGCDNGTTDITCSYHYSGLVFTDTSMISGNASMPTHDGTSTMVGNSSNGYAKITALAEKSQNNFLTSLTVTAENVVKSYTPTYDMTVNDYYLDLDVNTTNITISAKPEDSKATISGLTSYDIPSGTTNIPIAVTSESGDIRTYTLHVTRPVSTNQYPTDIQISGFIPSLCSINNSYCILNPDFNSTTNEYTLTVPYRIKQLYFTVIKAHPYQTVVGDGKITLNAGANTITIEVKSEDGKNTSTYTYYVNRDMTGDTDLSTFEVTDPVRNINYDPDVTSYYLSVPNEYTSLKGLNIITDDPSATYKITGNENFVIGSNEVYIIVTSASGDIKTYLLNVYREKSGNTYLSNLSISNGDTNYTYAPEFNKSNIGPYTLTVENDVTNVTLNGSVEVTTSKVTGLGSKDLNVGDNKLDIIVTAEDSSTETYTVDIYRKKNSNTNLSSITVTGYTLNETFNKDTLEYTLNVPEGITSIDLLATVEKSTSSYKLLDGNSIKAGTNIKRIMVIAEDGTTKTYTINITRPFNGDNSLSSLDINNGTLSPTFSSTVNTYNVEVENDIKSITITGTKNNGLSSIKGNGTYSLVVGTNKINITVTSEAGVENTYTVNINRKQNSNAYLSNITLSTGTLSPIFDKDTYSYSVNVPSTVANIKVTGVAVENTTTITGNNTYDLSVGENTIKLVTKAEDSSTKTYVITVTKDKSDNCNIKSLILKEGSLSPTFNSSTINYTATVPYEITTSSFIVNLEDNNSSYVVSDSSLVVGTNNKTITVTSEDGTIKIYNVLITREEEGTVSNYLSSLTTNLGTLSPVFSKDINYYTLSLPYENSSIYISGTLEDNTATIDGIGNYNLNVGENLLSLKVTSTDKKTRDYQVLVTRKENTDATINKLVIDGSSLTPIFDKNTYTYSLNTEYSSLTFNDITLTDSNASYVINGNSFTDNKDYIVTILVTAADKVTTKTYTLNVTKVPSSNAFLSNLEVSGYTISPVFNKDTFEYNLTVPNDINNINIIGNTVDTDATITGNGLTSLNVGLNTINITVTAKDGITTKSYILKVTREGSNNNNIDALIVNNGELTPTFDKTVTSYDISVLYEVKSLDLTINLSDSTATYKVTGNNLVVGSNDVKIIVTAANGDVKIYTLNVTRAEAISSLLTDIKITNYSLDQSFNEYVNNYDVTIDNEVTSLNISPKTLDPKATYEISGNKDFVIGSNTVTIVVTSSDNVSKTTYTLNVIRQAYSNSYLKYLTSNIGTLSPTFSGSTLEYNLTVDNEVSNITIDAGASSSTATVTGTGSYNLSVGTNDIYVTVKTSTNVTRTYHILATRNKSKVATLSSLNVLLGKLTSSFNSNTNTYTWKIPKGTSTISTSNISATSNGNSTISYQSSISLDNLYDSKDYIITVTSEDGTVTNTYTLNVMYDLSSDARLGSITIDKGYISPTFNKDTYTYDIYEYSDTSAINISGITNYTLATITSGLGSVSLNDELTSTNITVTAEDKTVATYKLNIHKTIKTDKYLSNLSLNGLSGLECLTDRCVLSPTFSSGVFSYSIKVPYEYTSLDLNVTKLNDQQTIKYKIGNDYITSYNLPIGDTTINVEVYDGMNTLTSTYQLVVTRCKSNNASLSSLSVEGYTISPTFNKDILEYNVEVPNNINEITITAITSDTNAVVNLNGYNYLQVGNNDATINVVAPDLTTKTYVIHISKLPLYSSYLTNITVSTGVFWNLSPKFSKTIYNYTVSVPGTYETVTIDAVKESTETTVTGTGEYTIKTGMNNIKLTSTATDGSTTIYNIGVIKETNRDVNLSNLVVNEGTISPSFDPSTTKYSLSVSPDISKLTIIPTLDNSKSSYIIYGNNNLVTGNNIISIIVMNEDKSATKTYQLVVNKLPSSNSKLSSLVVSNGDTKYDLTPVFDESTNSYNVEIPSNIDNININGALSSTYASVSGLGEHFLDYGNNIISVIVTAEDGSTNIYAINAYRNYDLSLKELLTDQGDISPTFDPSVTNYTLSVLNSIDSITVLGVKNSNKVTVTGNGTYSLTEGDNTINIVVTSPDSKTKTYTLVVSRAKSNNNNLSSLIIHEGSISPIFDKNTTEYTTHVRATVTSLTMDISTEDSNATYEIIGNSSLALGNNIVNIKVKAVNGEEKTYKINVIVESDSYFSNKLTSLSISGGTISPDFSSDINYYTSTVPYSLDATYISATAESESATITGDGTKSLNVGRNVITLTVTGEDGTSNTYSLIIYRKSSNDSKLTSLSIPGYSISPRFARNVTSYTATVGSEVDKLDIKAISAESLAKVVITGNDNIINGENTIKILVTAPDGITTTTYTLTVTKATSTNNYLSDLSVSLNNISPSFVKTNNGPYSLSVSNNVNSILVNATSESSKAIITGDGKHDLVAGTNTIKVNVTSESGDVRTYTIIVNKALNNDSSLSNIILSDGVLSPTFSSNTTSYNVELDDTIQNITVTGVLSNNLSTIVGNGSYDVSNITSKEVDLVVKAEDNTTSTYKVNLTKKLKLSSKISSLVIKEGELSPTFNPNTKDYVITVPNEITSLTMNTTLEDSNATYKVTGNSNFVVGNNTVTIVVVSSDSSSTTTYTLTVVRSNYASNYLKTFSVEGYNINPVFNKDVLYYEVNIPSSISRVVLNATSEDSSATIEGLGSINVIDNSQNYIKVTSSSGVVRTYNLVIHVIYSDENYLLSLISNVGNFDKSFDKLTNNYTLTVPVGTANVNLSGTVSSSSTVTGLGNVDLILGNTNHNIVVTSESGNTNIYSINIVRPASNNTNLSSLVPSSGNMSYDNSINKYSFNVDDNINMLSFNYKLEDSNATISGYDALLNYGENTINIVVTAEDKVTTRNIEIKVTRMKEVISITPSSDIFVLVPNEEKNITYTLNPTDTSYTDVTYESSNTDVATVNNGTIKGLKAGNSTIKITSTHNSNVNAYISVVVMDITLKTDAYEINRNVSGYKDYVTKIPLKLTINDFIGNFNNDLNYIKVYNDKGIEITDLTTYVGTGMTIKLVYNDSTYDILYIVVIGDIDGDGISNSSDVSFVAYHLLKTGILTDYKYLAGDVNRDGIIDSRDLSLEKYYNLKIINKYF